MTTTLTHPATGQTITVDPDHTGTYLTQGWVVVVPKPKKKPVEDLPD